MAARGWFVEIGFISQRLKLRSHLAGMTRMRAIVPATRRDEDRGIGLAGRRDVIGGNAGEELPIPRVFRVTELVDQCRTDEQLRKAPHVGDGYDAEQRTEPLWIAGEHIGDEQATVRSAGSGNAAGTRHPPSDKI